MKVLVVGSGGREHALVWKIASSPLVEKVYCAPGNAGIGQIAERVRIAPERVEDLAAFALREGVELTVIGPELPLTLGIVDHFQAKGLRVCGPSRRAAEIEGSKAFMKQLLRRYDIPTSQFATFTDIAPALDYVREKGAPIVVKADGLAAGKGVVVCRTVAEAETAVRNCLEHRIFAEAGARVVIEECLPGEEASYLVLTDGERVIPVPSAQDHKRVNDGDQGPNTGGMGAYSPAPVVSRTVERRVLETIIGPTISAMTAEGRPYKGVLYAGLMIQGGHPKVLEYNARFGDPETQPIIARLKSDIVPLLIDIADGTARAPRPRWDRRPAVCVVMASQGYPGAYQKGKVIEGLKEAERLADVVVFHAGTEMSGGKVVTSGGRVLGVTALGDTIGDAIRTAYEAVACIRWEGAHYRKDIGARAL